MPAQNYRSGELLTGELKKKCIAVLQAVVKNFQERKAQISDDVVREFMNASRKIDPSVVPRETGGQQKVAGGAEEELNKTGAGTTIGSIAEAEKVAAGAK